MEPARQNTIPEEILHLEAVASVWQECYFSRSLDGRVITWSRYAEELSGYPASEIKAQPLAKLLPESLQTQESEVQKRLQEGEIFVTYDTIWHHKKGHSFPVTVSAFPVKNQIGRMVGAAAFARNPSAPSESRDLYWRAFDSERKRRERLEKTHQELKSFASIISHDLQEPARSITMHSQVFLERVKEKLSDEEKLLATKMVLGASRMNELLESITFYSNVTEESRISFGPVNLEVTLQEVSDDLESLIFRTGAKVEHTSLPTVWGDAVQLRRLFENLISNAIKFTDHETPHIRIDAEKEQHTWTITVKDNGSGFDPKDRLRIFRMFERLEGSKHPGTGVGLAVCEKIISLHGGKIWADSVPGKGSQFHFTLHERPITE